MHYTYNLLKDININYSMSKVRPAFWINLVISFSPIAGAGVYMPPGRSLQSFTKQIALSAIIFEVEP